MSLSREETEIATIVEQHVKANSQGETSPDEETKVVSITTPQESKMACITNPKIKENVSCVKKNLICCI